MKQTMMFAIIALTAIVLMSSFGLQLDHSPAIEIPASAMGHALYVCPAASATWDSFAHAIHPFVRYIIIGFSFAAILLMFTWGWALYQNLLKDKFDKSVFKNPWAFTKIWFWAVVIVVLVIMTPNYFRTVHITGATGQWVLCDSNTPGAAAVRADAVRPR